MEPSEQEIARKRRYSLLAVAWAAVAVLTFPGILFPTLFPAGLFRVFGVRENDVIGHRYLAIGWLMYAGITMAACLSSRKRTYFIIYSILCLLLIINTVGCRVFWSDFRGVQ